MAFILCLGYKASVIEDYFLNYLPTAYSDYGFWEEGGDPGSASTKTARSLVDTGIWRNIGQRLMAVQHLVADEEIFLANIAMD
jgi:glucose-1-phosphate cytidylyltransferase